MDFLNKTILAIFLLTSTYSFSQNIELEKAFSNSYTLETNGEYKKAIETLKNVYSETSYETNLRLGWLNYSAGLFTEASAYYQKSIDLMPYSIEAKLGLIYPASALGNWNLVARTYEDILHLDPANYTANFKLGLIFYGREEYSKAYSNFQKVVNYYPFDYNSSLMFAWANLKLGKTREAKILFEKVLLLSPNDKSATEGLGLIK